MNIPHQMPTNEELRAEVQRKIDAGEPLGASHVHDPLPPGTTIAGSFVAVPQYSKLSLVGRRPGHDYRGPWLVWIEGTPRMADFIEWAQCKED